MNQAAQLEYFPSQVEAYLDCGALVHGAVPNLVTEVSSVGRGIWRLPVTVNHGERNGSWVCSPHTAYVRYAVQEIERLLPWPASRALSLLCEAAAVGLRRVDIDRAVAINNWTLSTNLFPRVDPAQLRECIEECLHRWPQHAIWVRSLNSRYVAEWMTALEELGFLMVPSRQVYLFDGIEVAGSPHANLRRDLKLLKRCNLVRSQAADWSERDFDRAAQLYRQLYLEKYSRLNPEYTARWLRTWSERGLLRLTGLRDASGQLLAVVGTFSAAGTMTAPVVGYDTTLPQDRGLYRLLMALVFEEAASRAERLNLSAGAAHFKRLRGGVGTMEYSAVLVSHLRWRSRWAVRSLRGLARHFGEPVMRRHEL